MYICPNTDLWVPFGPHILKACRVYKGEADKEDILVKIEGRYNESKSRLKIVL